MRHIVLISDGPFDHSFQIFDIKEEAEKFANKIKPNHRYVKVSEFVPIKPTEYEN